MSTSKETRNLDYSMLAMQLKGGANYQMLRKGFTHKGADKSLGMVMDVGSYFVCTNGIKERVS